MFDPVGKYQIERLQEEIAFHQRRFEFVPPWVFRLCVLAREFYWSVTRLAGLGHLHDASRTNVRAASFDVAESRATNPPQRRIFLDATITYASAYRTGIQRVVQELCQAADGAAIPVAIKDGRFCALPRMEPVAFAPGETLLLLDAGWANAALYRAPVAAAIEAGAQLTLCLYDMIPMLYPGFMLPSVVRDFETWLVDFAPRCAGAVAISRATAMDFEKWVEATGLGLPASFRLGWFPLGADFQTGAAASARAFPAGAGKTVITVSTLEPRKGHAVALDAFDRLWAAGVDVSYLIIGRRGWNADALVDRVQSHAEFGRRLHWIQDASDADIAALYRRAAVMLMPSAAEGFGLPLIEAAHYGAPIVASDIPVFREVAGDEAEYFRALDPEAMAACLRRVLDRPRKAPAIPIITWRQSAAALVGMLRDDAYQAQINEVAR